jgi:hypothetical protein
MDENLRTWVWFVSVVMAMTIGPALLISLFICGMAGSYRRYRNIVTEKVHAARGAYVHR